MRKGKPRSVLWRIVVPLLISAMLQSVLIVGLFAANGVFGRLRENEQNMLAELAQNKFQAVQSAMSTSWANLSAVEERVNTTVSHTLQSVGQDYQSIRTDAALNAALLETVAPELITCLRANNTTGVFMILDGIGVVNRPDTYAGLYFRDTDPVGDAANNSDIYLLRGLPPVSRTLGISLDSFWQASFTFPSGEAEASNAFFYKPLLTAREDAPVEEPYDGYWSLPFQINGPNDGASITYSEPLLTKAGDVYGVLGVEISLNYLGLMLGRGEFAQSAEGFYFLGMTEDGGKTYQKVATGGAKYKQYFHADDTVLRPETAQENGSLILKSTRTGETIYGKAFSLKLYASNTNFSGQQWTLIGLEDEDTLFAFARHVEALLLTVAIFAVVLGVLIAWLTGRRIVRPVMRLSQSLQLLDPNQEIHLEKTNILEIDCLTDAIAAMNHGLNEAAVRLSRMLRIAGLPVGVYEIRDDSENAYCSDGVFTLLGREELRTVHNLIPKTVCLGMIAQAMTEPMEDSVYRLSLPDGPRYVRIRSTRDEHGEIGTVLDMTSEMEDRQRIEQERDHDLLTGILNRRAFETEAEALFIRQGAALGVAAMIMLDLDNLKFLNDTYGHDCGDGYIRSFAESLSLFGTEHALVARRSGDEFYVLLYGGTSKEQVRSIIQRAWSSILERFYLLPDNTPYKMRVSAGVAWYPDNARELRQLIHFADFAMYKVKRSAKGSLEEFNAADYNEDSFLISGRDALDRLIDNRLVRFAVQPILSARTGDVYGYELLMRTNVRELPDPLTVLRLANAEGKLQHIERLTWLQGLEAVRAMLDNRAVPAQAVFFLNSIANQTLNAEDELYVEQRYAQLLPRMVIEVTESEKRSTECTDQKLAFIRKHGGRIAIDDFGTGYNSELALVQMDADIVKLDISFVHGVDSDLNKQALIQNLIDYARQRGIAVLAEGVETREEMRTLIRFGVDYLQGFYLGQPQYQPMNVDRLLKREIKRIIENEMPDED